MKTVPLDALGSFSRLARTYGTDYAALADFFGGDPMDPAARALAADRAAAHARHRDAVADVLADQNRAWNPDPAVATNLDKLRRPDSVAVVTGQQVGLFAGPLYTPYKTLTTILLARRIEQETGRPAVPVFWLADEDHDFAEVARTYLLCRNSLCPAELDAGPEPEAGNRGPVGRIVLDGASEAIVEQVETTLVDTDFKPALMEALRTSYRPGATLRDAFARFLRRLFPEAGLVFISPDDARLKRLAVPLFRREIESWADLDARLRAQTDRLEQDGYRAQVHLRPTNLFLLEPDGRLPLDTLDPDGESGGFVLRGTDRRFSKEELLALLEQAPERFSPNVVLRPLLQDVLLPTAAYVAGPGETAYYAQIGPAYDWAEQPRPLVYPRASVTLVEGKVQKVLDRYGLALPDLEADLDVLFQRLVLDAMEVDLDAVFSEAAGQIHEAVNGLKPEIERVDPTLGKSAEAMRAAFAKELEKLKQRAVRAEKRQHDEVRQQLEKVYVNLMPHGKLQERVLSPLYFLNKYSLTFFADLADVLALDTTAHQVVEL